MTDAEARARLHGYKDRNRELPENHASQSPAVVLLLRGRFDRKSFIRKLVRGIAVKRMSYITFLRWLDSCHSIFARV